MENKEKTAIKAVVFDWGGVLIVNPVEGILAYVERHFPEAGALSFDDESVRLFQEGRIEEATFWQRVGLSDALDLRLFKGSLWRSAFESTYTERDPVMKLAYDLQAAGITTAMLSNTELPAVEMLKAMNYRCFDYGMYSCEWGVVKPDSSIYLRCVETLGIAPEQILFIDDKVENIRAAEAVGMRGHVMDDCEGLDQRLTELGLPNLRYS